MDADFWLDVWREKNIAFHQDKFHPQLKHFSEKFSSGKIMVPLCGKSLDMIYLSQQGHKVVGVELSELACRSFFEENKIAYTEKKIEGYILFESEMISLWCGDFFKLPQEAWDNVTGVYDRAALIALPPEMRQKYGAEFSKHLKGDVGILLISLEYASGVIDGPPFSVGESEIREIYEDLKITKLHSQLEKRLLRKDPDKGEMEFTDSVYWIQSC